MPEITLIIPAYNRATLIGATLADIAAQTCRDFSVILVDNASTDSTADLMRRWAELQPFPVSILTETRRGAATARRRGAEEATTPWLLFFDSDDHMAPDHIERVLKAIREEKRKDSNVDIIGWDIVQHLGPGKHRTGIFADSDLQFHSLFHGTMATQRYCVKRDLYHRAGGWNPAIGIWDDIELGARLLRFSRGVRRLSGSPTVETFLSPDSITHGETAANLPALDKALTAIAATLSLPHTYPDPSLSGPSLSGPSPSLSNADSALSLSNADNPVRTPDRQIINSDSLLPQVCLWIQLKRILIAANTKDNESAHRLKTEILTTPTLPLRSRLLLAFAYRYTRLGLPGAARLLRPFLH